MQVQSNPMVAVRDRSMDEARFTLTPGELILAGKAVEIARREIDAVEFHTRLGADVDSADRFLSSLAAAKFQFLQQEQSSQPAVEKLDGDDGGTVVALDIDELSLVNNALNEVVHGLREEDSLDLGEEGRARARRLLDSVNAVIHGSRSATGLSATNDDRLVKRTL